MFPGFYSIVLIDVYHSNFYVSIVRSLSLDPKPHLDPALDPKPHRKPVT